MSYKYIYGIYKFRTLQQIRMKKYVAFLFAGVFMVVCCSLYMMLEMTGGHSSSTDDSPKFHFQNELGEIEDKISSLEQQRLLNKKSIDDILDTVKALNSSQKILGIQEIRHLQAALNNSNLTQANFPLLDILKNEDSQLYEVIKMVKLPVQLPYDMCLKAQKPEPIVNIKVANLVSTLPFDNPDGGVWKQGYDITYDQNQWSQDQKLKVFVVPHSHNDPGWIKTFDQYFTDQTKRILDNMVNYLDKYTELRFIYAEMSFFSLWWTTISADVKDKVKKFVTEGRLELVTAGWVMTDEANAHYFAMIDQMIEGNQWLKDNLGITPTSGWAIDPFGHSPTMAYLLNQMGFQNMLIQRTHYSIKKYLSEKKALEFTWRQSWDSVGSTEILCHMMPFYSYDVPHTCGPDPSICCQFDFKRMPGGGIGCPWHKPPIEINTLNIKERAMTLLDQYRKKAQLYSSNVVFAPLGDDFRWDTTAEWDNQYNNYKKLIDYMNQESSLNVEIQFGTLTDYFKAVKARKPVESFVTLAGDFFTYSDRDDHYWSGYYTSRPFFKRLDRIVEDYLRSAEIAYTLALVYSRRLGKTSVFPSTELQGKLTVARRNLALYQHHDGITGTAKDHVVNDYGTRLRTSLDNCKSVMQVAASFLLYKNKADFIHTDMLFFGEEDFMASYEALPMKTVVIVTNVTRPLTFYNSLAHPRTSVVHVIVDQAQVLVTDLTNSQPVRTQISPVWTSSSTIDTNKFKLSFMVDVPALGFKLLSIQKQLSNPHNTLAKITLLNVDNGQGTVPFFQVEVAQNTEEGFIHNSEVQVRFSAVTGLATSVLLKHTEHTMPLEISFVSYGAAHGKERSGAYLFLPDGPAKDLQTARPLVRVVQGPILSEVKTRLPLVEHTLSLQESSGVDGLGLGIVNTVDIRSQSNMELAMRITTKINNTDRVFYTDLNGFQMSRRQTLDKLPIQGNFYPMPSAVFLQDNSYRLSILSGQSLGVGSLSPGTVDIIQDRRLQQDDNRGLGQGVLDNRVVRNRFRIHLLPIVGRSMQHSEVQYLSAVEHAASQDLIYPLHFLPPNNELSEVKLQELAPQFSAATGNLGFTCDMELVNLRTGPADYSSEGSSEASQYSSMILRRTAPDCRFEARGLQCNLNQKITFVDLFNDLKFDKIDKTSLSLVHSYQSLEPSSPVDIDPMNLQAYQVLLK